MPESQALENAMKSNGLQHSRYMRLHNVVDDFFYTVVRQPQPVKQLLHVSCFEERSKNIKGLLRAVKMLSTVRRDFRLVLTGNGVDYKEVREYAKSLAFPEGMLVWTGELTPEGVAEEMSKADVFVLFSNYENAPVVISEALASGVPVVSSSVGGVAEMVSEQYGILTEAGNEREMAEKLDYILGSLEKYDRALIRRDAKKYSYDMVGKQLHDIYKQLCTDSSGHTA